MTGVGSAFLAEASDPATSPSRLAQLSRDSSVRPLIAANPNCPLEILNELAPEFPLEVFANPVVELALLEGKGDSWSAFDMRSLIAIFLAKGGDASDDFKRVVKARLVQACEESSGYVDVVQIETWSYSRNLTISVDDFGWLEDFGLDEVDFDISLEVQMEGRDVAFLDFGKLVEDGSPRMISLLFDSMRDQSAEGLFDLCADHNELDLSMDNELDERISVESTSEQILVKGLPVYSGVSGKKLFDLRPFYVSNCDDEDEPVFLEGEVIHVPIHDHQGSDVDERRFSLSSDGREDATGELTCLWGWEPGIFSSSVPNELWTHWLARMLLD